MAQWHDLQQDFSGGEISTRMLMRAGDELYEKSLLQALNFMPSLQGTLQRAPGTRYIGNLARESDGSLYDEARIIPYVDGANQDGFIVLTEDDVFLYRNLDELTKPRPNTPTAPALTRIGQMETQTTVQVTRTRNGNFADQLQNWEVDPERYVTSPQGGEIPCGVFVDEAFGNSRRVVMRPIYYDNDRFLEREDTVELKAESLVVDETINPDGLSLVLSVNYALAYDPDEEYEGRLQIGTADGTWDLVDVDINLREGQFFNYPAKIKLPTGYNGTIWQRIIFIAKPNTQQGSRIINSIPTFVVGRFELRGFILTDAGGDEVGLPAEGVPWAKDDLKDIHFVQSPYANKELVLVHPLWPPHRIIFKPGGYLLERIVFVDNTGDEMDMSVFSWQTENYPSTCTSYHGRLMLGGSKGFGVSGSTITTPNTETVWGTVVGNWSKFSYNPPGSTPPDEEEPVPPDGDGTFDVNPDSSIEFTAKYRSPIQWLYGQKDLLIGARDFEYIASGEGIFSPGDIGVNMHSSHGSNHVQPAGLGEVIFFPGEGGTRLRAMGKSLQTEGWLAPDMTLYNPEITSTGIKRIVRMRNPHSMILVLTNSGDISILHIDSNAQVSGWSRYRPGGDVLDLSVIPDKNGVDVLYLLTRRQTTTIPRINLEAVTDWTDSRANWGYTTDSITVSGELTSTLYGLEHLEEKIVQVIAATDPAGDDDYSSPIRQQGYLGSFRVRNGQINLVDRNGFAIEVTDATIGMSIPCRAATLPIGGGRIDPGAKKRFSELSVRIRASILPQMAVVGVDQPFASKVQRPADRTPAMPQNQSQAVEVLRDVELTNLGHDEYQIVVIEETLPLRCEILGIYGKMTTNSL